MNRHLRIILALLGVAELALSLSVVSYFFVHKNTHSPFFVMAIVFAVIYLPILGITKVQDKLSNNEPVKIVPSMIIWFFGMLFIGFVSISGIMADISIVRKVLLAIVSLTWLGIGVYLYTYYKQQREGTSQ